MPTTQTHRRADDTTLIGKTATMARSVLDAARFARDPEGLMLQRWQDGGDLFRVQFPGLAPTWVTSSPAGAQQIFAAPPDAFDVVANNPVGPLLGRHSLIMLGGDAHLKRRRQVQPAFGKRQLDLFTARIATATREVLSTWRPGQTLVAQKTMQEVTLRVICQAVFGVIDSASQARFLGAMAAALDTYTAPLMVLPFMRRAVFGKGPWARFQDAQAALDTLLLAEIRGRRAELAREDAAPRDDVLTSLIEARDEDGVGLTDDELRCELRTLLVAGHETSATSLVWALYYARRDPAVWAALRASLANATGGLEANHADFEENAYLKSLCKEVLRLHPVVPIVIRQVARPFDLLGTTVPTGANVAVALTNLHRHPDAWQDAHRFIADRFVDRRTTPFEYAPFGGGHRRCLGAGVAEMELRIILGIIVSSADLALGPHKPLRVVTRNITTGPDRPLHLKFNGWRRETS